MTAADKVFTGGIPALYEQLMVPMIFAPYARDMAERIAGLKPARILEVACGTGVVTRAIAGRLGSSALITATDISQPMLDIAARLQDGDGQVGWQQADGLDLPFADQAFDAVVCQFGVMFFPDRMQGYREARRVLMPGGAYIFNVWDSIATNAFVMVVNEALERRFPADPPRFMTRTPHGYFDIEAIRQAVTEAGFSSVVVETIDHLSHAGSPLDAATAYCQGTPLRAEIEARAPGDLQDVTRYAAGALARQFGTGRISGRICAHIVTAIS